MPDGTEIPKTYYPSSAGGPLHQFWLEGGYFTPRMGQDKQPFPIIMPPPNVTGELHLGHARTATIPGAPEAPPPSLPPEQ
jgi:valyl-tRNA synthetase